MSKPRLKTKPRKELTCPRCGSHMARDYGGELKRPWSTGPCIGLVCYLYGRTHHAISLRGLPKNWRAYLSQFKQEDDGYEYRNGKRTGNHGHGPSGGGETRYVVGEPLPSGHCPRW